MKSWMETLKNGVIMDVVNVEQAKIAEAAGAKAVMALERVPSDIKAVGGVARMTDPALIEAIQAAVTIPVMAKVRIGHAVEASILQALNVDMIDESEVLTPADYDQHIDKTQYKTPFVCGAKNLGEALRRIDEGAQLIRKKGEAGTGDVSEAVKHMRMINGEIKAVQAMSSTDLKQYAKALSVKPSTLQYVYELGRLPVMNLAAGGVATPADAAFMMRLGTDGVFVGSGVFKSDQPEKTAKAIVEAVKHYDQDDKILELSKGLGAAMKGTAVDHSKT